MSSKINLQTCEYARKSSIFQDNQLILVKLHYVFVVADGRSSESEGLSIYELAQLMKSYGCETAYNLDGGGSSTIYFNGHVINRPTTNGRSFKEREVSDIVYIGY